MKTWWLIRLGVVAAVLALVAWFISRTEWVEEEQTLPARGAAAEDGNYALAQLVGLFGASFEHRRNLETLPPRDATLLLEANLWDLFPERREQVRRWVENGGHLVIAATMADRKELRPWLHVLTYDPVAAERRRQLIAAKRAASQAPPASSAASRPADDESDDADNEDDANDDDEDAAPATPLPRPGSGIRRQDAASAPVVPVIAPASEAASGGANEGANGTASGASSGRPRADIPATGSAAASAALQRKRFAAQCHDITEPADLPPALPGHRAFRRCGPGYLTPIWPYRATPEWWLESQGRRVAMRIPVGRGTVTVSDLVFVDNNADLARDDGAAILAALLQLHPGQVVWDIDDESQPVLAVWLWDHARSAILLGALALFAWLWRRAVRFGPRVAEPESARRSIGEQIAGIGAFLRHHEPAALQRAERRALEDLARRRLAGFDLLDDGERARAIADATRTDPAALLSAMRPGPLSTPAQWLAAAAALEQARRALGAVTTGPARPAGAAPPRPPDEPPRR